MLNSFRKKPYKDRPWVKISEKKPFPFDLMEFKDTLGKIVTGWFTGQSYEFNKVKDFFPIEYRRYILESDHSNDDWKPRMYRHPSFRDGKKQNSKV